MKSPSRQAHLRVQGPVGALEQHLVESKLQTVHLRIHGNRVIAVYEEARRAVVPAAVGRECLMRWYP